MSQHKAVCEKKRCSQRVRTSQKGFDKSVPARWAPAGFARDYVASAKLSQQRPAESGRRCAEMSQARVRCRALRANEEWSATTTTTSTATLEKPLTRRERHERQKQRQKQRQRQRQTATLREEVPGMAGTVWTADSRVAVRGVQDAAFPQQGHVSSQQHTKDEKHDEYNEWSQTVAWSQQDGGCSGSPAHRVYKSNGVVQALALAAADTGKSIDVAERMYPYLGKHRVEEGDDDEASSVLWTEDGPSAGPISTCCRREKTMQ